MARVIVAGGRDIINYQLIEETLNKLEDYKGFHISEIVSGGCSEADKLGETYALEHGIPIKIFEAQWGKYGNKAGPIRNRLMAEYGDVLVAFWNGESKGTKNMIETMEFFHKPSLIIKV